MTSGRLTKDRGPGQTLFLTVLLVPALDLHDGRSVRLLRGDFEKETVFGDPLEIARGFRAAGARRLHVVDLDAARGGGSNRSLVARLVTETGLEVQVAGGVRRPEDVAGWLAAGAVAAVMGTTAVRRPELLKAAAASHPGAVLAALDVRDGRPAVTGWTATEEVGLDALLRAWDGAPLAGVVLTCIDRDGTLEGPDLDTLREVLRQTRHPVVYSGGIGRLEDVSALARAGAAAAILGRALLEGRFSLDEARAAAS